MGKEGSQQRVGRSDVKLALRELLFVSVSLLQEVYQPGGSVTSSGSILMNSEVFDGRLGRPTMTDSQDCLLKFSRGNQLT